MNKSNNNKRNNKNKRKPRQNNYQARLKSVVGVPARKLIQTVQLLAATAGATTLTFSPLGFTYYNLNDLANSVDFQNMATAYQVVRFRSVKLIINRVLSESQLTTVFPGGLESLYIAYFPTVSSSTISAVGITSMESAMVISPFNNRATIKTYKLPNIIAPSTPAISLRQYFSVNNISNIKGQFAIGSYGTGNAAVTANIYSLTVQVDAEFAVPF
jgi:hypothetical protein